MQRTVELTLRLGDDMPATGEVDVGGPRYLYLRTGSDREERQLGTLVPVSGAKSARYRYFPLPGARRAWQGRSAQPHVHASGGVPRGGT